MYNRPTREDLRAIDIALRNVKARKLGMNCSRYLTIQKLGRLEFMRRNLRAHPRQFSRVYVPYWNSDSKKKRRMLSAIIHIRRNSSAYDLAMERITLHEDRYRQHLNQV